MTNDVRNSVERCVWQKYSSPSPAQGKCKDDFRITSEVLMRKVCLVKTSLFICHSAAGKCNDDLVLMQTRANLSPRFLSVTRNCQLPNHPCSGDSTPPPLLFFLLYNALLMLSSLQYVMLCCVLQTSRLPSSLSQEIAK